MVSLGSNFGVNCPNSDLQKNEPLAGGWGLVPTPPWSGLGADKGAARSGTGITRVGTGPCRGCSAGRQRLPNCQPCGCRNPKASRQRTLVFRCAGGGGDHPPTLLRSRPAPQCSPPTACCGQSAHRSPCTPALPAWPRPLVASRVFCGHLTMTLTPFGWRLPGKGHPQQIHILPSPTQKSADPKWSKQRFCWFACGRTQVFGAAA